MHNSIKTYRDLIVWQKALQFVTNVYAKSASLPQNEQFGLTSQIRRSAVSIPSNIAEGYGRNSTGDYTRFLQKTTFQLKDVVLKFPPLIFKGRCPDDSRTEG